MGISVLDAVYGHALVLLCKKNESNVHIRAVDCVTMSHELKTPNCNASTRGTDKRDQQASRRIILGTCSGFPSLHSVQQCILFHMQN